MSMSYIDSVTSWLSVSQDRKICNSVTNISIVFSLVAMLKYPERPEVDKARRICTSMGIECPKPEKEKRNPLNPRNASHSNYPS